MNLVPCARCRRHVEVGASACPFCGDKVTSIDASFASSIRSALGRVSRAAVFASATACASSTPHAAAPPPPPPSPSPAVIETFAKAPPPADGKASLRGFVLRDGRPVPNASVYAKDDQGIGATAKTGEHGEFEFLDLAPGTWHLTVDPTTFDPYAGSRAPQEGSPLQQPDDVTLDAGNNKRHDLVLPPLSRPADRGPCCKPYGAPPARRRVV